MSAAANQAPYGPRASPWGDRDRNRDSRAPRDESDWFSSHWVRHVPKPVLIGIVVLGFIAFWPIGLALLAYIIWSKGKSMTCWSRTDREERRMSKWQRWAERQGMTPPSSGNRAFDEYRTETLRRLEEEQKEFGSFLDRLRFARDKAEFDQFMAERRQAPPASDTPPQAA